MPALLVLLLLSLSYIHPPDRSIYSSALSDKQLADSKLLAGMFDTLLST
jgi:hypothetical protein